MMPRSNDIDFDFLQKRQPHDFGLQRGDRALEGVEYANFFWKESFTEVESRSKIELLSKGWHRDAGSSTSRVHGTTFFDGKGSWITIAAMSTRDGTYPSSPENLVSDPHSITVNIVLQLPPGLWSEMRTFFFGKRI